MACAPGRAKPGSHRGRAPDNLRFRASRGEVALLSAKVLIWTAWYSVGPVSAGAPSRSRVCTPGLLSSTNPARCSRCRGRNHDLLYADELKAYEADGVATVITACSRIEGFPRRYVQHALEASADQVWEAMQHDGVVFVYGNASTMAPEVRAALIAAVRAKTGAGEAGGAAWLAVLRASHRYLEDIWGETAVV
jgi:hypothetical protein